MNAKIINIRYRPGLKAVSRQNFSDGVAVSDVAQMPDMIFLMRVGVGKFNHYFLVFTDFVQAVFNLFI